MEYKFTKYKNKLEGEHVLYFKNGKKVFILNLKMIN